jgi:hypothetical protein
VVHQPSIHATAKATGKLERFVIFGSYITDKVEPNDVDVVLVMADDFRFSECSGEPASCLFMSKLPMNLPQACFGCARQQS